MADTQVLNRFTSSAQPELTQEQLAHTRFPLGEMCKPDVRESARQHGLNVLADKPDSQEICFVPGGD